MTPSSVNGGSLISIAALVAVILMIAWREFGRPRHALTWSIGFALAALMWTVAFGNDIGVGPEWFDEMVVRMLAGFVIAINTIGFRQRSGLSPAWGTFLLAAGANALIALALAKTGPAGLASAPLGVFEAAMFLLAAGTLTGRRRSERVAERLAAAALVLLAVVHLGDSMTAVGRALGLDLPDPAPLLHLWTLMLPAVVTGIGLFTIFLLAADLADRTRRLANTDILTGLLNRRGFEETARNLLESARRHKRSLALVMIDLDRFKTVNDRFGHPVGDAVLRALGQCLQMGVDGRSVLARIGGEEFALILADLDEQHALVVAERLRQAVGQLRFPPPGPERISASFGVAMLEFETSDLASWALRADEALYRSKAAGRDRVTVASRAISGTAAR